MELKPYFFRSSAASSALLIVPYGIETVLLLIMHKEV